MNLVRTNNADVVAGPPVSRQDYLLPYAPLEISTPTNIMTQKLNEIDFMFLSYSGISHMRDNVPFDD
jgi:hypothetical protein